MRFKPWNALLGGIVYLYLFGVLFAGMPGAAVLLLLYAGACMLIAWRLIARAESRRTGNTIEFAQSGATDALGFQWGSFHHVFHSKEAVNESFRDALGAALRGKLGYSAFQEITLKDVDRDLPAPEARTFLVSSAKETTRHAGFSIMCGFTRSADIQGVRWWLLVSGIRDPNKTFWFLALSPVMLPFILYAIVQRQYDPLKKVMTVYPGFFNEIDIVNRTRELQFVAFETLVEVLDSFGIDTSDLKQQKANILSINVSGGQTSFGSVVQGAMNKVSGMAVGGGAKT
ncbi:hypothetical protein [Noviherbaspirillum sp. ST9]|uniref:hypothetical protein n=1 Tax=Noviherbaspirillum sp. ST9 TaxID=3401606 RepID=UPI003B58B403